MFFSLVSTCSSLYSCGCQLEAKKHLTPMTAWLIVHDIRHRSNQHFSASGTLGPLGGKNVVIFFSSNAIGNIFWSPRVRSYFCPIQFHSSSPEGRLFLCASDRRIRRTIPFDFCKTKQLDSPELGFSESWILYVYLFILWSEIPPTRCPHPSGLFRWC